MLQRLQLLKTLNTEVELVYKKQSANLAELQNNLKESEDHHSIIIDGDEEKHKLELKLKELEKTFVSLRAEVETTATHNEKLRISKDERLNQDLNSRVFADHKPNDLLRDQLRGIDEKRQN